MPRMTLTSKTNIGGALPMGASLFLNEYLFGIPLSAYNQKNYSLLNIKKKLVLMTRKVELLLGIKIGERTIDEVQDYNATEWLSMGYIKLNNEVNEVLSIKGMYNDAEILHFDADKWVHKGKTINYIPYRTTGANAIVGVGGSMFILRGSSAYVPNFWHIQYKTGMKKIEDPILELICKLTAIQVLSVLGDIALGIGITSENISFDGLSQSYQSTKSASSTLYGARIKQYVDEINGMDLANLRDNYRGLIFDAV